jgi:hypothetical protein
MKVVFLSMKVCFLATKVVFLATKVCFLATPDWFFAQFSRNLLGGEGLLKKVTLFQYTLFLTPLPSG